MRTRDIMVPLGYLAGLASAAADSPRPRGVGPEFAKYYKSAEDFACISKPSVQVSIARVNDDYCDCPDGSDEPGTSACAHLSHLSPQSPLNKPQPGEHNTTIALPGFYCKNKGHQPAYLPFTRVNDGICDYEVCCDGSDEWEGVGGTKCPDKCQEIGKEWKRREDERQRSFANAIRKRKELVAEAARLKEALGRELEDLKAKVKAGEEKVSKLEAEKTGLERTERQRQYQQGGGAGKASVLAGLAKSRILALQQGLRSALQDKEAYHDRMRELERLLATFKKDYNPNFNDEGVKRAVQSWEDYAATNDVEDNEDDDDDEVAEETDTTSHLLEGEDPIPWEEFEGSSKAESDVQAIYDLRAYLPPSLREWIDSRWLTIRSFLEDNSILAAPQTTTNRESPPLRAKRTEVSNAEFDLKADKTRLKEVEEDLTKDFGPDEVFRSMKDKCVSLDSGEYTYEVCWMQSVTQKSKKGSGRHGMGNFDSFATISVDDELPADGKGLGSGQRTALKYDGGAHCWNGPDRSTTVVLACAEVEEVWKVTEEEKCVYRIEAGTPAVCDPNTTAPGTGNAAKDEL